MGYKYAVLGAGQMGVASAYDLAKFGEADQVIIADNVFAQAEACAVRINGLLGTNIAQLSKVLDGVNALVSAVPFQHNLTITELAIRQGTSMTDLGGHTGVVRKQILRNDKAKAAGVTIVPDCGMGPGMNISLAVYAMSLLEKPKEVLIWDGGLPQKPEPPWNYALTFNINGLTNEYFGNAYFLKRGKVTEVPCFEGYEEVKFPKPLGMLEAFVTSGGLSTMPWTFKGKLRRLENKTLRYRGHCEQFKAYSMLGLFDETPVKVGRSEIRPRKFYHNLLEPKIVKDEVKDVGIIRVKSASGPKGQRTEATVELIDYYDDVTGFTAMQRLTGWHASIVAILAAQGKLEKGAVPVESAVPGELVVEEAKKRGLQITQKVKKLNNK
jgi:lysine 6-dehydrogenase